MRKYILPFLNLSFSLLFLLCFSMSSTAQKDIDAAISDAATTIMKKLNKENTKTIGIIDFTMPNGTVIPFGQYLAEEFAGGIVQNTKKHSVIDRNRVNTLLKEANFDAKDLTHPKRAAEFKTSSKIDIIFSGMINPSTKYVKFTASAIDISSGKILGFVKGNIKRTPEMAYMFPKIDAPTIAQKPVKKPVEKVDTKQEYKPTGTYKDAENTLKVKGNRADVNGVEFKLLSCKALGRKVICDFNIVNKSGDVELTMHHDILLHHKGKVYKVIRFQADGKPGSHIKQKFITGVPVRTQFIFDDVPTDIAEFEKLSVYFYAGKGNSFEMEKIVVDR